MKKQKLTKEEYKILLMAQDATGLTSLIYKELSLTKKEVNKLANKLVKKGLLTKVKSHLGLEEYWYEITELGETILKNKKDN